MTVESMSGNVSLNQPSPGDIVKLPPTWSWSTLGDVAEFFNGDRSSNYPKQADFVADGIPFVNTGHIDPTGRLALNEMDYISRACFDRLRGGKLKAGDIVYCLRGSTIGKIARVDLDEGAIASSLVIIRPKDNSAQDFLYYFLSSPLGQRLVRQHDNGSAQPNLSVQAISRYPLPLPPIGEQREMLALLNALDDKIEQNRLTGAKLEGLARAVFKAWFVDFEPVKAKAAGATAFPGMPPEAFAALPNSFQDSPLGPVPQGWEVRPIGDVVTVRGGGTPSTKDDAYWNGGTHYWATPKDLSSLQHPILLSTERRITDAGVAKISSGMLPIDTVLLSSRAPVGYLALAKVPTAVNQGFIAIECDGPLKPHFMLHWLDARMEEIKSRASGTTFAEISKSAFRPIPAVVPPSIIASTFEDVARPIFDMITHLMAESAQLAALRDYLLPRLLSGRVRCGSPSRASAIEIGN